MTHEDMVAALLQYIQTDANLVSLLRLQATKAVTTVLSDDQLTTITTALGIYQAPIEG